MSSCPYEEKPHPGTCGASRHGSPSFCTPLPPFPQTVRFCGTRPSPFIAAVVGERLFQRGFTAGTLVPVVARSG